VTNMTQELFDAINLQFDIKELIIKYANSDKIPLNNVPYLMGDIEKLLKHYTITHKGE
jgi:hypothetical protein